MSETRKRNPEKMKKICSFVEEYFFKYHRSPTMQKIADELGVSKSTAYYYINEMAEKGMLSYDGKTISTSSMQKSIHFANRAPMIGNIVCGTPEYSEENFEGYVALPEALFGVVKRITIEKKRDALVYKNGSKDQCGHGTLVTNLLTKYLSTNINLYVINIFKDSLSIDIDMLIEALEYCTTIECDLIQVSLGTLYSNNRLHQVIKALTRRGTIIVSAFDNDKSISYPAAYSEVVLYD